MDNPYVKGTMGEVQHNLPISAPNCTDLDVLHNITIIIGHIL